MKKTSLSGNYYSYIKLLIKRGVDIMSDRRKWFKFYGPFGTGFHFGFSPFGWWETYSVDEELEMLNEYKDFLEEELKKVNERIERLSKK